MRPLKILHLCPFFYPVVGGLEQVVQRLSTAMVARGHEVSVFTSDLGRNGRVGPRREILHGVSVRRFPSWLRLGTFASFWPGFCLELRTQGFDIIHAHSLRHPHCDIAALPQVKRGAKLIIDPHWAAYPRGTVGGTITRIYDALLGRRLLGHADLVLCATPLEVPWLQAMGAKAIRVLPHGVPSSYLGEQDGQTFRRRHGVNGFLVVSVGRTDESKGFQFVIQALRKVEGVHYVVAGPRGPYYPELVKLIYEHRLEQRVTLLGQVSENEKLDAIDAADVVIQPSVFEAYGVSTLEALARGRPVLTSNVGGLPWLANDCGLVFEAGNVDEIARCLQRLRDSVDLRRSLGASGRTKARHLTWEQIIPQYEGILHELARR